jgi:hypothetical protein
VDVKVLEIVGWNVGFQKIPFTNVLRSDLGYSLSEAKAITDAVLEQKTVALEVDGSRYALLVEKLSKLGARLALSVGTSRKGNLCTLSPKQTAKGGR